MGTEKKELPYKDGYLVSVHRSSGMFSYNTFVYKIDVRDPSGRWWPEVVYKSEATFFPEFFVNMSIRKAKRLVKKRRKMGVVPQSPSLANRTAA